MRCILIKFVTNVLFVIRPIDYNLFNYYKLIYWCRLVYACVRLLKKILKLGFLFNLFLFGNKHTLVYINTMSCETGSGSKRKAYIKVISCKATDGITPEEDHEDLTTSWKIEGRSENVVKMKPFQVYKIILRPYHVLTTFTPRPCQVLTTSIRFPMSSYHALTTLTPFIVR